MNPWAVFWKYWALLFGYLLVDLVVLRTFEYTNDTALYLALLSTTAAYIGSLFATRAIVRRWRLGVLVADNCADRAHRSLLRRVARLNPQTNRAVDSGWQTEGHRMVRKERR